MHVYLFSASTYSCYILRGWITQCWGGNEQQESPRNIKRMSPNSFREHDGKDSASYAPARGIVQCNWKAHMTWWRHKMETFAALQAICAGNSPVTGGFPTQRPVTRSFDVFFDLRLNKRLSREAGDWRRYRAHYDVIVMRSVCMSVLTPFITHILMFESGLETWEHLSRGVNNSLKVVMVILKIRGITNQSMGIMERIISDFTRKKPCKYIEMRDNTYKQHNRCYRSLGPNDAMWCQSACKSHMWLLILTSSLWTHLSHKKSCGTSYSV